MKTKSSLGSKILDAIYEALETPGSGRLVRPKFDVKNLRKQLHLTQRKFSERYHINLETIRNWEQEKRSPDSAAIAFLTCIERNHKVIEKLLASSS